MAIDEICSACHRAIHDGSLWLDQHAVLVTDHLGKSGLDTIEGWRPFHRECLQRHYPNAILPPAKPLSSST